MGNNIELMKDLDGKYQILFIDKGGKKEDVGSKLSDFEIKKPLGQGNFGSVFLVSSKKTKLLYAMKEIKQSYYKSYEEQLKIQKEIKLLENLHHPHVITYFTSFIENENFYIITDYMNGGSLENLFTEKKADGKLISEKKIWDLLVQSLSGLLYLHDKKKIIHRDIKPDNILLDFEGNLKISDFGISAVISEEAEDSIKCHGTTIGPLSFMSPEMSQNQEYGFKSDIYMLGLTFFFIISGQMPEKKVSYNDMIISFKNNNAEIPEIYSKSLKNFIQKLLKSPEERPSTKKAYLEATIIYIFKYLNITSILSSLQCLLSYPSIGYYFKGDRMKTYMETDKNNEKHKYLISKIFRNALFDIEPTNFNYEMAKAECLNLRINMFSNKERLESTREINSNIFVPKLLVKLHNELNKYINHNFKSPGMNNINEEEEKENNKIIDKSNEQIVISSKIREFTECYRSKISDYFFYLSKYTYECLICQKVFKYSSDVLCLIALYPYRASIYLKKRDINIIDLFKHFRKKRLFFNGQEYCPYCNKKINQYYENKILYTSPINFILNISSEKEDQYKIIIDEYFDISNFVERNDIIKTNYHLVGAIFTENNENEEKKYVSISKNANGGWFYFNGSSIKACTFNDLANHKQLRMLFYTNQ